MRVSGGAIFMEAEFKKIEGEDAIMSNAPSSSPLLDVLIVEWER
jgi:hypothetical protein